MASGDEVSLLPMYTPIRVDEENVSTGPIFFGGINCYLNDRYSWFHHIPRFLTRWLDSPSLIQRATKRAVSNDAKQLGTMTLSMMQGEEGPHRQAAAELADFVKNLRPDVVVFSNAMLCAPLRLLKRQLNVPTFCVLQGDDLYLEGLVEPYKSQVLQILKQRVRDFDGFLTHSSFYRRFMSSYFDQPVGKFHLLPLAIDCLQHSGQPKQETGQPPTIGYFARICPEKGLHQLVKAVIQLRQKLPTVRLKAGGYLGEQHQDYFQTILREARPLGRDFEYVGSPSSKRDKVTFLKSVDLFCVPTVFREPKGLYVLEAWANGIPTVLPRQGSFPELVASTGGGLLYDPANEQELCDCLWKLLTDSEQRLNLAEMAYAGVRQEHDISSLVFASQRFFAEAGRSCRTDSPQDR